ncbi:class I SAM-dependent methyltransferase [Hyphococcus lacteus]|uniref:Methyltransferase domain-containing protein n=1 Tax=Hyphococcus lacteus TaxID=3143536 RepID=A0ABV3Z3H1_9PROT
MTVFMGEFTVTAQGKVNKRFWDKVAAKYAKQPIADQESYEHKLKVTREYLTPETRMFEFGCGTGSTAILHAPNVEHILALDVSDNMLAIARDKAREAGVQNIDFEQSTIENFTGHASGFDVILGMSIVHLLVDRKAALAKVYALLKPNGVFVSSTVCLNDSMGYLKPLIWMGRMIGKLPYVDFLRKTELIADLREAGFEIEYEWQPSTGKVVFIVARKSAV